MELNIGILGMRLINLLPKPRQEQLHFERILQTLYVVIWLSVASFGLVFLAQVATKIYLGREDNATRAEIEVLKSQLDNKENAQVQKEIKAINDVVGDYKNLAAGSPKWSKVLKAFAPLPPAGIKINSFAVNNSSKVVNITGVSPTRELVIQLYNNINADSEDFSNIDYPLDNLVKETNAAFHFTFNVNDPLLK